MAEASVASVPGPGLRILAVAALLALPGAAAAVAAGSAPPLVQPAGAAGCLPLDPDGCVPTGTTGSALALLVRPDGRELLVSMGPPGRIRILRQRGGRLRVAGCLGEARGCRSVRGLRDVDRLAQSADGRVVAALSTTRRTLALLRRESRTGPLRLVGCLALARAAGCRREAALGSPNAVGLSGDGARAVLLSGDAAYVLRVGRRSVRRAAGCMGARGPCRRDARLAGATAVALPRAGREAYVATAAGVVGLRRQRTSERLTVLQCVGAGRGCESADGLQGATAIAIAPHGDTLYVGATGDRTISSFSRDPDGRLTRTSCLTAHYEWRDRCVHAPDIAITDPASLAVSHEDDFLFVADRGTQRVLMLNLGFGATLQQGPLPATCIGSAQADGNCLPGRGLSGLTTVVTAPRTRTAYVLGRGAVAVLRHVSGA